MDYYSRERLSITLRPTTEKLEQLEKLVQTVLKARKEYPNSQCAYGMFFEHEAIQFYLEFAPKYQEERPSGP